MYDVLSANKGHLELHYDKHMETRVDQEYCMYPAVRTDMLMRTYNHSEVFMEGWLRVTIADLL